MATTEIKRNKPFIRRWIKALRSGKYKQAHDALHITKFDDGVNYGYCCLGVACHISSKVKMAGVNEDGWATYEFFGESCEDCSLPQIMLDYIGINENDASELIDMNDVRGKDFNEIADKLEQWIA